MSDGHSERALQQAALLADQWGQRTIVSVIGEPKYYVPREYIALHGIKAQDLPALAEQFGWEKV